GAKRLADTIATAIKYGKGNLMIAGVKDEDVRYLSRHLMCPTTGIAYEEPEPNLFSFNSPYGACPRCSGLGQITDVALDKIVPDRSKSVKKGAIVPLGTYKNSWVFKQIEAVLQNFGHDLSTPIAEMEDNVLAAILNGMEEPLRVTSNIGLSDRNVQFEGIIPFILEQAEEGPYSAKKWASSFTHMVTCPERNGSRLKKTALFFRLGETTSHALASL